MYFENQDYSHCYLDKFTIKELITALSLYAEKYPTACIRGVQDRDGAPCKIYGTVYYNLSQCKHYDEETKKVLPSTAMIRRGRARPSVYKAQWDLPKVNNLLISDFIRYLKTLPTYCTHLGIFDPYGECYWIQGFWKTPRTDNIYLAVF